MGWLLVVARMVPYIEGFDMRTRSSFGGRDVVAPTRDIYQVAILLPNLWLSL